MSAHGGGVGEGRGCAAWGVPKEVCGRGVSRKGCGGSGCVRAGGGGVS